MPIRDRSLSKAGGGGEAVSKISTSSTHRSTASSDAISAPIAANDAACLLATPLPGGALIDTDDIRTPVAVASPTVLTAGDEEELLGGARRTHRGSQKTVSGRRSTERMHRRVSTAIDSESLPMIITTTLVPIDQRSSNQRPQAMARGMSRKRNIDGDCRQKHE